MSQYSVTGQLETTANKPMVLLFGNGVVLPEINLIRIGFNAPLSDSTFRFGLFEHTNAGVAGTSITPKKIGPGAPASCMARKGPFALDPTRYGVAMVTLTCHHRAFVTVQKEFGAGYKPEFLANHAGLGIWCEAGPDAVTTEVSLNWWE